MKTLADYNLLICTPSGKCAPDSIFLRSLIQTREYFKENGGNISYQELPGCSEICGARAELFRLFYYNPEHTHMLFIDDDTGWEPKDVARMLLLDQDFIAAVAPQKRIPIDFAFSSMNEFSEEQEIEIEKFTHIAKVKEVGTAFLMISRNCATSMVESYPELTFLNSAKQKTYALFDPIIVGDRRYADDYSFSYRWREIGGEVKVLLDVELAHAGRHIFKASLWDALQQQPECKNIIEKEEVA